jgi:hypothetical protein
MHVMNDNRFLWHLRGYPGYHRKQNIDHPVIPPGNEQFVIYMYLQMNLPSRVKKGICIAMRGPNSAKKGRVTSSVDPRCTEQSLIPIPILPYKLFAPVHIKFIWAIKKTPIPSY